MEPHSVQNDFSRECLLFILGSWNLWRTCLPLLTSPFMLTPVTRFRKQFLRKMWPIHFAFLLYIVCRSFHSSFALCNTSCLAKSFRLFSATHFNSFQTYLISFSTIQSYGPNVALLLAVIMNTSKLCHSKIKIKQCPYRPAVAQGVPGS